MDPYSYNAYIEIDLRQDVKFNVPQFFGEEDAQNNTINGKTIYQHILDISDYDSNLRRAEMAYVH